MSKNDNHVYSATTFVRKLRGFNLPIKDMDIKLNILSGESNFLNLISIP